MTPDLHLLKRVALWMDNQDPDGFCPVCARGDAHQPDCLRKEIESIIRRMDAPKVAFRDCYGKEWCHPTRHVHSKEDPNARPDCRCPTVGGIEDMCYACTQKEG